LLRGALAPGLPKGCAAMQGPLAGLSERMRAVLHGAGDALAAAGARDLGALVLQLLDARHATGCEPRCKPRCLY